MSQATLPPTLPTGDRSPAITAQQRARRTTTRSSGGMKERAAMLRGGICHTGKPDLDSLAKQQAAQGRHDPHGTPHGPQWMPHAMHGRPHGRQIGTIFARFFARRAALDLPNPPPPLRPAGNLPGQRPSGRGNRSQRNMFFFEETAWDTEFAKRDGKDRIRQFTVAGALLAAEIDRLIEAQKR